MAVSQDDQGAWTDSNGNTYLSYSEAEKADSKNRSGGGSNGSWGSMSGYGGTIAWFALLFVKLFIVLVKYGILQSFVIGITSCAALGIVYALITQAHFLSSGIPIAVTLAAVFTISVIAWNVKKIFAVFFIMAGIGVVGVGYSILVQAEVIDVPDYMWPVHRSENFVQKQRSGGFRYITNEAGDGIIITELSGLNSGDIVIPAKIDGLPVVKIENGMFRDKKLLKQVTLPESLKFIGGYAFERSGLTSVIIPEGVTDIGEDAFKDCTKLASVTLPKSLKRVGGSTFTGATSLVNVEIPSGSRIQYGFYGEKPDSSATYIEEMDRYFKANSEGQYEYLSSFRGCTSLSAASQKAIQDSGYKVRP
jgi:hypothetical protein